MNQRVICSVDEQQRHLHLENQQAGIEQRREQRRNDNQASGEWAGAYIVNIMHAAFLLVVLFERVVAVKFPGGGKEKAGLELVKIIWLTRDFQSAK